jgi:LDH2 family malate/lactate/ureidoglycolate dehydrogenase
VPTFAAADLLTFARSLFEAAGVPTDEAAIVAQSLLGANLCGHDSHGVIRILQYLKFLDEGRLRTGVPLKVLHEAPAVVSADGQWGLGQVQAHRLLERLFPRARQAGLCAGTLKRCGHIGRLGEYAETAAAQGFVFMATVNNHGYGRGVAPPGGIESRIGTNPISLGSPTIQDPLVLDIGTSVVAEGKVRVAFNKGVPAPEGWLLDEHGQPTTDPGVLYREPRGSILPLGGTQSGYKGFGLGLLLDVFAGALSGAQCSHPDVPPQSANAVFFLVIDMEQFSGRDHFLGQVNALTEAVRATPRAPGVSEILLPGDPERRERAQRQASGIPLDEGTWKQLRELANGLGVTPPTGG